VIADEIATWPIDKHSVKDGLHRRQLRGDMLAQRLAGPERLRLDAAYHGLGLIDQVIELIAGMNVELPKAIEKLDDLIERLASPVSDDLLKDGWSEDSAAGIRTRLEAFRGEIDSLDVLPPLAQRPLGMVRALGFWRVQEGELVDELARFEHDLRRG